MMRRFHGNQYTNREEASIFLDDPPDTIPSKSKRIQYTTTRSGYTARHAPPFPFRKQKKMFRKSDDSFSTTPFIPSGMRLLDVSILAMTKIRCFSCGMYLALFESKHCHDWPQPFTCLVNNNKSMQSESLSVRLSGINSAFNGIDGGTGCNFFFIKYNYINQSVVWVAYCFHCDSRVRIVESGFLKLGHIAPWGHRIIVGPY